MKVSGAVGTTLNELHLSMEAFGDTVVFGEAPHAGDLFLPAFERSGETTPCSDVERGGADQKFSPI